MGSGAPIRHLVDRALDEYSAEYRLDNVDGLSNHLPMCLHALSELGASAAQLERFYAWYVPRLAPRRTSPLEPIEPSEWRARLGRHAANHEYFLLFERERERKSQHELLGEYLPVLFAGVGGGAFHPLIRLAYALEMRNSAEISEALASWCMAHLELGTPSFETRCELRAAAEIMAHEPHFRDADYGAGSIYLRMQRAAADPVFKLLCPRLGPSRHAPLLPALADLSLHAFLSAPSFVSLHLMTSVHALRVLEGSIEIPRDWLEHYWIAWMAAYATLNAPAIHYDHAEVATRAWPELFELAAAAEHDHLNKFVYTCSREHERYGNPLYHVAADRYCTEACNDS
jgi:hypothetical protein